MQNLLFTELADRSLISLSGADTLTFLQGIVTNDVDLLTDENALYAAILTPQGKFLDDFFLIRSGDTVFLDCSALRRDILVRKLSLYRLRADVTIAADDTQIVAALFAQNDDQSLFNAMDEGTACPLGNGTIYIDPRNKHLGARMVLPNTDVNKTATENSWQIAAPEAYREKRLGLTIAEGPNEIETEKSYPMDFQLDILNGISFTKGCYVGQEVTARIKSRNLVKRRPVSFQYNGTTPGIGSPVLQNGSKIGEVRATDKKTLLALIRIETSDQDLNASPVLSGDKLTLRPKENL